MSNIIGIIRKKVIVLARCIFKKIADMLERYDEGKHTSRVMFNRSKFNLSSYKHTALISLLMISAAVEGEGAQWPFFSLVLASVSYLIRSYYMYEDGWLKIPIVKPIHFTCSPQDAGLSKQEHGRAYIELTDNIEHNARIDALKQADAKNDYRATGANETLVCGALFLVSWLPEIGRETFYTEQGPLWFTTAFHFTIALAYVVLGISYANSLYGREQMSAPEEGATEKEIIDQSIAPFEIA